MSELGRRDPRGLLNVETCAVDYGCLWMHVELSIHFKRKEGQDKGLIVLCEMVLCETKRNEMKSVLCELCEMKICTLRNENLYFAKWKSVLCEMKICTLRNENLYFPENRKPLKLRPSGCLENLVPRKKTFFHSVFAPESLQNILFISCQPAAGQGLI